MFFTTDPSLSETQYDAGFFELPAKFKLYEPKLPNEICLDVADTLADQILVSIVNFAAGL